jgi:hypothetical protein
MDNPLICAGNQFSHRADRTIAFAAGATDDSANAGQFVRHPNHLHPVASARFPVNFIHFVSSGLQPDRFREFFGKFSGGERFGKPLAP